METTKVLTKEEIQAALEERHSPEKQKKLSEGRVTIAGLGGLGSNVAYALARIGVGHLHLIDFDVVDITNLNRQQYFTEHIGMYKTDALKSLLQKINPYIDIQTDCIKVTEENLISLFENAGIICEAFDNPEAKAMLVNGILEHFPEKKLVSASGMAGYGSSNAILTKRLMNNFYLCGDQVTETGRAKKEGVSYLFYVPEEKKRVQELLRLTRNTDLCTPVHFDFNHEHIVVEKKQDSADRFQIKCYF